MSNLRSRLATRVEPIRVEVEDTYIDENGNEQTQVSIMLGMPDDYTLTIGMLGEQEQLKKAALYNAHLNLRWPDKPEGMPSLFTKDDPYKILLVEHYLQPDVETDEGGETIFGEDGKPKLVPALSEIDIAMMSKEHGPLFTKLFAAAVKLANNKTKAKVGDVPIDEDPMVTVGLGKSETGATESSPSP